MKIIGLCGAARSGKDSFYTFSKDIFKSNGILTERIAFADELKQECLKFLKDNTGLSPFTKDPKEKEIIRPFLVTYGTHIRRKLNPNCWIDRINKKAKNLISEGIVPIVTDVRYPNEADWIHSLGGKVIHISRFGIEPINTEERENDPILKNKADETLSWQTFGDSPTLYKWSLNPTLQRMLHSSASHHLDI